ncbi:hypothetical protein PUN28_000443 [Cardiocondyla obscurior]|uniref:Uncharacterized protein n=1 Tax=Cardiocondyla obscurior TaxID=286306 RepID=A0AAW2GZI2_9HYME
MFCARGVSMKQILDDIYLFFSDTEGSGEESSAPSSLIFHKRTAAGSSGLFRECRQYRAILICSAGVSRVSRVLMEGIRPIPNILRGGAGLGKASCIGGIIIAELTPLLHIYR